MERAQVPEEPGLPPAEALPRGLPPAEEAHPGLPRAEEAHPGLPPVEEVRPGLWSLPVPIPNSPLRYVLAYAFEVPAGVVLVDPGWNAPESLAALEAGLGRLGTGLAGVRGILVTHIHPDHYGLAGRVRELSGAWVALHPADAALVNDRYEQVDRLLDRTAGWLRATGAPEREVEALRSASMQIRRFVVSARPDVLLEHGDRPDVPGWRLVAVHTPGHTPGHLCFHEEGTGVLLTGDHVLPRISPNVSAHPQSTDDPLGDYLTSLKQVQAYAGPALPGHQWRFDDLPGRVDELLAHHEERLDEAQAAVAAGAATVWEVARALRWSRPWEEIVGFMRRAALGETQAHLIVLERRARIVRVSHATPLRWRAR
ncbi:MAG TPA: MBL fold metallo-hydrolase [Actinomycetes bacterium]|nr:MBL fold metallo-hydrolase [Actinomycetes bacterium]